jgi:hypothetical protein
MSAYVTAELIDADYLRRYPFSPRRSQEVQSYGSPFLSLRAGSEAIASLEIAFPPTLLALAHLDASSNEPAQGWALLQKISINRVTGMAISLAGG